MLLWISVICAQDLKRILILAASVLQIQIRYLLEILCIITEQITPKDYWYHIFFLCRVNAPHILILHTLFSYSFNDQGFLHKMQMKSFALSHVNTIIVFIPVNIFLFFESMQPINWHELVTLLKHYT